MAAQGIAGDWLSRPIRLAADLSGQDETALEHLFIGAKILVRLEEAFANVHDARETFLFTVNQVIRFCPNVAVCTPVGSGDLVDAADDIAVRVHGERHRISVSGLEEAGSFQAIVNVGTEVLRGVPSVTVNSTGWVARVASADSGTAGLPWARGGPNPIGALAAACLGAGRVFFFLIGQPLVTPPTEISLFTLEVGPAGALPEGPPLPVASLELDGFLVGCGAVTNGWAYAVKRLPIVGHLEAVDRQVLRIENIGPYVASGREWLGKPKAEMIAKVLGPAIGVTPRPDEWEFFKIRLRYGLRVPPIVVNGLDNVETRHSVQRLWPEALIDMASGGLTSQVILKARRDDGICLLRALHRPAHEVGWAERLARETGLPIERILEEPTTAISEDDIEQAPEDKRVGLERARENGQFVCGRVTEHNLHFEGRDTNFAPAVPFVTGFSGVAGAAATMKWLMGYSERASFHFQHSFASGRARRITMKCDPGCDCWTATDHVGARL
jgi:hypothetical protein